MSDFRIIDGGGADSPVRSVCVPLARLREDADGDVLHRAVEQFAGLVLELGPDPVMRLAIRENAVKLLRERGVRGAKMIDAALKASAAGVGPSGQGQALDLEEPEPWPDPVDGAELLRDLVRTIRLYVAMAEEFAAAIALWLVHAHAPDASVISPRLAITSPEKRCGKTTTLEVLYRLVRKPLLSASLTVATLFRVIEKYGPVLLIDEADQFLGAQERGELRGILNAGHRAGGSVLRCVGDDHEPRSFLVYGPVVVALIGRLYDTLADRSIEIPLRRRRRDEKVERLRLDRDGPFPDLRSRLARWAADNADSLRSADPDLPDVLHDRARDNWRPLIAAADLAGGEWPELAREAAAKIAGGSVDEESAGVMLLADLREMFEKEGADRLASETIVENLATMDHRPWPEWRKGSAITKRQVAKLLGVHEIKSRNVRTPRGVLKGYEADDFAEAWERYLPPPCGNATPLHAYEINGLGVADSETGEELENPNATRNPLEKRHVAA